MRLLALALLSSFAVAAPATPESGYAASLWQNGRTAVEGKRWSEAAAYFERLTSMYPADPNALEAQRLLGVTWLEMGEAAKAIGPLKRYFERRRGTAQGVAAALDLGRAYLASGKRHEALLLSDELLNKARGEGKVRALALKADALIALDRDERAERSASSAAQELAQLATPRPELRASIAALALRLKLRSCGRFPSARKLEEAAAQSQFQRRGICLQEALALYEPVLSPADVPAARSATRLLNDAWQDYRKSCTDPPPPPGPRTAAELGHYRRELTQRLLADLEVNLLKSRDILNTLKERVPGEMVALLKEALPAAQ